jgi:hypothetical protein
MPTLDRLQSILSKAIASAPLDKGFGPAMEAALVKGHTAAVLAAAAERAGVKVDSGLFKGLSKAERADIKKAVAEQLQYLKGFLAAKGELSEAQIRARAQLYAGSIKQTYYLARWGDWDIPHSLLPGQQQCLGNCLCRISIADKGDGTGTLTRTMGGTERHCTECPPLQGDHEVKRKHTNAR